MDRNFFRQIFRVFRNWKRTKCCSIDKQISEGEKYYQIVFFSFKGQIHRLLCKYFLLTFFFTFVQVWNNIYACIFLSTKHITCDDRLSNQKSNKQTQRMLHSLFQASNSIKWFFFVFMFIGVFNFWTEVSSALFVCFVCVRPASFDLMNETTKHPIVRLIYWEEHFFPPIVRLQSIAYTQHDFLLILPCVQIAFLLIADHHIHHSNIQNWTRSLLL